MPISQVADPPPLHKVLGYLTLYAPYLTYLLPQRVTTPEKISLVSSKVAVRLVSTLDKG